MKTLLFLSISIAGITAVAAPAVAQLGQRDPAARIAQADANGDGVVTRAEFKASRSARFDEMDRNGDGFISRDDFGRILKFRPQAGQRLDEMLAEADSNHDGRISRAELDQSPMPLFDRADTNRDGKVDAQELAALRERASQMRDQRAR